MGILASEVQPLRPRAHTHAEHSLLSCTLHVQHAATLGRLCPVHRLDRNVSGLLVFARGAAAANSLRLQIMARCPTKPLWSCQPLTCPCVRRRVMW